jgi:DNA-3-methyladenine glycosylase II
MKAPIRARGEAKNGLRHAGVRAIGRARHRHDLQGATILDSEAALKTGLSAVVKTDPVLARLVAEGATPSLRKRPPGFEGLAWIIVGQQLSTASAAAIWGRLKEGLGDVSPARILERSDADLRAIGLSTAKIRTLRAAATEILEGRLLLDTLGEQPADDAHDALVRVKGIGPWTADVYLLFCLGHPDAFPAGDLALQEAARIAYELGDRPDRTALTALAERWRPWRGVAAKVLWAYYRLVKSREGAPLPTA